MRRAWGTVCYGFWPMRHTPLDVMHAGVHNRDERIHVDDVGYAARFLLHAARPVSGTRLAPHRDVDRAADARDVLARRLGHDAEVAAAVQPHPRRVLDSSR